MTGKRGRRAKIGENGLKTFVIETGGKPLAGFLNAQLAGYDLENRKFAVRANAATWFAHNGVDMRRIQKLAVMKT